MSGGSDHQPKELLIVTQILLISTLENVKNSLIFTVNDSDSSMQKKNP